MMLMTNDVARHCHADPIDPILDHRQRRRVLTDLPRHDGAAEV